MIREGAGNTENQDFELKEQGNTEIHFIGTSRRVPTRKASIFSRTCQNSLRPNYGHNLRLILIW